MHRGIRCLVACRRLGRHDGDRPSTSRDRGPGGHPGRRRRDADRGGDAGDHRRRGGGAEQTPSLLRVDATGTPQTTRMHIAIVDRNGQLLALHSMEDAWPVSIDIALAKAYTAAGLSSNENAISSRSIGLLTQPGGALWNIGNSNDPGTGDDTVEERGLIEFPGGLPLYKNGVLVGGIGVSGDGVDQDELWPRRGRPGTSHRRSFGSTACSGWRGPTPPLPHRARGRKDSRRPRQSRRPHRQRTPAAPEPGPPRPRRSLPRRGVAAANRCIEPQVRAMLVRRSSWSRLDGRVSARACRAQGGRGDHARARVASQQPRPRARGHPPGGATSCRWMPRRMFSNVPSISSVTPAW